MAIEASTEAARIVAVPLLAFPAACRTRSTVEHP
jgi:hypothetical protein